MAEIKISELSVGDWVMIKGTDKIVKIAQINGDVDEIRVFGYKHFFCFYDLEHIEPIPLTPEILERNGWSRKNNYGWYLFYDKYIRINIWFDKDRWDIEVSSEDRRVTYADITGRGTLHTHQLQHALRLAGVEKEIEV